MSWTGEDFAQANLATKGDTEMARRSGPMETMRWLVLRRDGEWEWINDAGMAAEGWTPVLTNECAERIIEVRTMNMKVKLDALREENKSLRVARDELRTIVDELHAEIRGLRVAPIGMDALAAAWEAAERAGECREGDVVIADLGLRVEFGDGREYTFHRAVGRWEL